MRVKFQKKRSKLFFRRKKRSFRSIANRPGLSIQLGITRLYSLLNEDDECTFSIA
jgi:hypothetical protein